MAYAGLANKKIVAALQTRGVNACGLKKQFSSLWVSTSMGILEKYLTPENIENAPIAVSYTHLDVYKRQMHYCLHYGLQGMQILLALPT